MGAAHLVRSDDHSLTYRAPHETRGHDVVVEVLPGSQGEAARDRFAREQQALGRLAGVDGVVPLLEAGVTVDGDLYLMTAAIEGRTLEEILATGGPMAWADAARVIEAAATTLHHAHVVGVTHRRIDPDTIVIADDGRVLITGLGSAGLTMDAGGSAVRPGYTAPEIAGSRTDAGSAASAAGGAGPAVDIYGLGATLWALLAGRRPFTAPAGGDESADIIERSRTQRVGDLSAVAPAPMVDAVEWATAPEPQQRPSSAATFARALRNAAADAPSGFLIDPDAVIAGWQPLGEPDESGRDGGSIIDVAAPAAAVAAVAAPDPDATIRLDTSAALEAVATDGSAPGTRSGAGVAVSAAPGAGEARTEAAAATRSTADSGADPSAGSDDGRRAGLLVGLGVAAIALVALAASAALVAFVGDDEPVTITGPSIEPGPENPGAPAEVLGVDIEADPGATDDAVEVTADEGAAVSEGSDDGDSVAQSSVIEPFPIPTPTPDVTILPGPPADSAPAAGPTQPPAQAAATPTPSTIISAPPPPPTLTQRPTATPTPQTTISAPPAPPPAPTSSPTPVPTIAAAPTTAPATPVPATATPAAPSATPSATATPTPSGPVELEANPT